LNPQREQNPAAESLSRGQLRGMTRNNRPAGITSVCSKRAPIGTNRSDIPANWSVVTQAPTEKIGLFEGKKFIGNRSLSTITALYARGLVTIERNKKGYITHAICVPIARGPGEPRDERALPTGKPHDGTRYSFKDHTIQCLPWDLRRLTGLRHAKNYAPASVIPDFTVIVTGCLRSMRKDYSSNVGLLARIFNSRMPDGSLFLLLAYQPPQNGHRPKPLVLTRVDHQPTVNYVAGYASDQARKRDDAESRELAQVLSALLGPRD
jgi:hypothetical protein